MTQNWPMSNSERFPRRLVPLGRVPQFSVPVDKCLYVRGETGVQCGCGVRGSDAAISDSLRRLGSAARSTSTGFCIASDHDLLTSLHTVQHGCDIPRQFGFADGEGPHVFDDTSSRRRNATAAALIALIDPKSPRYGPGTVTMAAPAEESCGMVPAVRALPARNDRLKGGRLRISGWQGAIQLGQHLSSTRVMRPSPTSGRQCGSGGSYRLLQGEMRTGAGRTRDAVAQRKADTIGERGTRQLSNRERQAVGAGCAPAPPRVVVRARSGCACRPGAGERNSGRWTCQSQAWTAENVAAEVAIGTGRRCDPLLTLVGIPRSMIVTPLKCQPPRI
jgi:hypothetical protein